MKVEERMERMALTLVVKMFKSMANIFLSLFLFSFMLILSWNVNGLRDLNKMEQIFASIKESHASLCFLQETFWDDSFIERYKHLWDGTILYNNCPNNNRKGVALLISKSFPHTVQYHSCDSAGRIMKITFLIGNCEKGEKTLSK